ncbi:MAG: ABC transporter substrate-binding protein, partial [Thermoleophilia bacterium]
ELVLVASRQTIEHDPELVESVLAATTRGYELTVHNPKRALEDLLAEVPSLEPTEEQAQLNALLPDLDPKPFDFAVLRAWASWDLEHGLLERPLDVGAAFELGLQP